MDPVVWKATMLTAPSVIWIYLRFFNIFWQRYRVISHHAKTGGARMFIHLTSGFLLLLALPLMALLCIPPHSRAGSWIIESRTTDSILIIVGIFLLAVNGSTTWLLPHPKRYGEYKSQMSQRLFAKSVSLIHATNFQFLAMTLSAFGVLSDITLLKVHLFGMSFLLYIVSLVICIWELNNYAWEENNKIKDYIFPFIPHGPISKSNVIGGMGEITEETNVYNAIVYILLAVGGWGQFQVSLQLLQVLLPQFWPHPSQAVQDFFPVLVIYMTLVMDAGFFTLTQSMSMKNLFWGDILLTQALPVLLNLLGYEWVTSIHGKDSGINFMKEQLLWTRER